MWRRRREGRSKAFPQTSQGSMFLDGFKLEDCLPRGRTGKKLPATVLESSSITFTSNGTTWFGLIWWFDLIWWFCLIVLRVLFRLLIWLLRLSDSFELREIVSLWKSFSFDDVFFGDERERSNGDSVSKRWRFLWTLRFDTEWFLKFFSQLSNNERTYPAKSPEPIVLVGTMDLVKGRKEKEGNEPFLIRVRSDDCISILKESKCRIVLVDGCEQNGSQEEKNEGERESKEAKSKESKVARMGRR